MTTRDDTPGPEQERRHQQLGRLVRRGLDTGHVPAPDLSLADCLYRQAQGQAHVRAARAWPVFLGGFGAVCAAAALLLAWLGPGSDDERQLVWVSESNSGGAGSPSIVGHVDAAEVIRFSDASAVTFRPKAWGRILGASPRGASLELGEGRANFHLAPRTQSDWRVQAGPYTIEAHGVDAHGPEFEVAWSLRQEMLSIGLFAGKVGVRGPGAAKARWLRPGESLVARARDGLVRVGSGQVLLAALSQEESVETVEGLGKALVVEGNAIETAKGVASADANPVTSTIRVPDDSGICPATEPVAAALVPDPGPISLLNCRHTEPGATGKDVQAHPSGEAWVRPGPGGCLQYAEDSRGNRIPDFSKAGYRGGGVPLPVFPVANEAAEGAIEPSGGDDSPAIQAAIDAAGAQPLDAQGFRRVVQLSAGVFNLRTVLLIVKSGVVLRGQGTEGEQATVLRGIGAPHDLVRIGPVGRRRPGRETFAISDVYVPVGARSFTVERAGNLRVGDDIIVFRPKTQRWICAIGTDVLPARLDGAANPPWRANGSLSYERRITRIDGNRITVDTPLTNALEKEYTQAYVTTMEFPERISEVGVENLVGRGDFVAPGHCPPARGRVVRADTVINGWIRHVRAENMGADVVSLGSGSKWMTVEDTTYVGSDMACPVQTAFTVGGQQNLFLRVRTTGSHLTALMTETEVEGPNVVSDLLAVGREVRVRVAPRWTTGLLLDNVRLQDANGQPTGEIDLARAGATFGWSAANSVLWNSDAEALSVDSPPTAHNWIMGGASDAKSLLGTGVYGAQRAMLSPQSLYRAQLVERLGRLALAALGRPTSTSAALSGTGTSAGKLVDGEAAATGAGVGSAASGNAAGSGALHD